MKKDDVLAAVIASAKADGSWTATYMKERWLLPGAAVPVDMETTTALVTEIKRLRTEREWVGLTDEEMLDIERNTTCEANESWLRNVTCNIEQALKEKNT